MTFTIIKKGNNNFWHLFNNGAKEVNLSDFQAVLDSVAQTFIIQALNGANVPQTAVGILDIIVIDETDASLEETFANVEALRTRLVELGYTPYLGAGNADSITGLIEAGTNVTITGDGTTGNPYVINSSGGGGGGAVTSVNSDTGAVIVDLESVLTEGNRPIKRLNDFAPYEFIAEDKGKFLINADGENATLNADIFEEGDTLLIIAESADIQILQGVGVDLKGNGGVPSDFTLRIGEMAVLTNDNANNWWVNIIPQITSQTIPQTTSFTAEIDLRYTANGTLTVTDPTPVTNKGYIVHVIGGTSTIGGVGYTTGDLVYRYYDGSSWISKNYNQDLQSVLTNGGTVIEGDNELYLDVVNGQLEFGTVGAVSSSFFKVNSDEDIIIANANNVSQKNASIQIDTDGNLELIQKNATNTFGTGITITEPTANRSITFKDESGTVALLSDIGGVGATQNARATRLELTGNISLPISVGGSVTVIDFDNTVFNVDPTVFTNNGAGTITCTLAGNYLVTTSIVLESPLASAITKSELGIRKNGTNIICATTDDTPIALGNNIRSLTTSTIINLSANDTLQAVVNLFGASATGQGLRLPSLFGTTATQVSNISIERLEVSEFDVDATPTDGSSNAVSSNGVFDALATKVSKSDYTPAHSILVQQSGTGTPTALSVGNNTLVGRLSGGGSDINDLSVSDVRTLLSIDTDLALKQDKVTGVSDTEIGYLDGVTSSIQTQLDNRSKTIWKLATPTSANTGTTSKVLMASSLVSANTLSTSDVLRLVTLLSEKTVFTNTTTTRLEINTSASLSGSTVLATSQITGVNNFQNMNRGFVINGGNIKGLLGTASAPSDVLQSTVGYSSNAIDVTNDFYLLISHQHNTASDSSIVVGAELVS
jgi:hypothetical protein